MNFRSMLICRCGLLLGLLTVIGVGSGHAANCYSVTPTSLSIHFANQAVGTTSPTQQGVIVTNNCTTNLQITSLSLSPSEFLLGMGYTWNLPPKQKIEYGVRFRPSAAQTFTGAFTIGLAGNSPIVINLSGNGTSTGAVANLSTTSMSFHAPAGKTSNPQTVTLTNLGTTAMTVLSVYTLPPFSTIGYTGGSKGTVLQSGQALNLKVAFSPSQPGTYPGTLVISSDVLNPVGVTLTGTATAPTSLTVTNFPTLPAATQGAAYSATLTSAGGTGDVTYALASGSALPTGLQLSSAGIISGTLPATLKLGNYQFMVTATDAASHTANEKLTLSVGTPTGAKCSNIFWNVAGTQDPLIPITDLGTGTYLGAEGGLYPNGSNVMPANHQADGVSIADSIQPLDSNGNPDPNGKYGLLSLGLSVTFENYWYAQQAAMADGSFNPHLVLVNGANPNLTAARYANANDPIWTTEMNYFLPQAGVTANQIVAAWVMVIDGFPTGTFPSDMTKLQSEYESIAQNLHNKFPNIKLAFFSPRDYSGYSNGMAHPDDPEPFAYESAFAVRGMIFDQLNGAANLNYNSANGPVTSPWVDYGEYDWANGLLPRSDGQTWSCQDFLNDGTHNSIPGGREKGANDLLEFLKTSSVTTPWVLATP